MPMVYPLGRLAPEELDQYLAFGRRRSGKFLYHTACPFCSACEPTRIPVNDFAWTRSLNRVLRRGDKELRVEVDYPKVDSVRLGIFNKHRMERGLNEQAGDYSSAEFESFLVASCCETKEFSFWQDDRLVGCAIIDCGKDSLSAVYTYFDPDDARFSPGTYAILKQVELALQTGRRYLYLGLFVARNRHLSYKGRFTPQERYVKRQWLRFEQPFQVGIDSEEYP